VDADSDRSLVGGQGGFAEGGTSETSLTQHLISTLEPVVGVDKIRASVNVDYDQGTTEESQERYDPAVSALLSDQKSEEKETGGTATGVGGGVPGTSSNVPTKSTKPAESSPAQNPTQTSTTESAQYGVNKTETHTIMPAGRIKRITAAILVDDAIVKTTQGGKATMQRVKRSPEELAKIQQIAEAVIGFDAKRGDTISVQDLAFDTPVVNPSDLPAPKWTEKVQKTVTDYSSLLRPVSLLALFLMAYLFVLRPIQKQALAPGLALPAGAGMQAELPGGMRAGLGAGSMEPVHDTRRAAQLKEQTIELIKQKPVNTARAVQAWMREDQG
jgi:flagellar M-ring protein FliF